MYGSASPEFADKVLHGGEVLIKFDICNDTNIIHVASVGLADALKNAVVTIDDSAECQQTVKFDINMDMLDNTSWLTQDVIGVPSHNEIRMYRGFRLNDGNEEYVIVGTFHCESMTMTLDTDGAPLCRWEGTNRSGWARMRPFAQAWVMDTNFELSWNIEEIVRYGVPNLTWDFVNFSGKDGSAVIASFSEGDNPWTAATQIAKGLGTMLVFGAAGDLIQYDIPNPQVGSPVLTWDLSDPDNNTLLRPLEVASSADGIRNGVIVKGSAPWLITPVWGEAWDENPNSPTYYQRLGKKPYIYEDPFVSDSTQAQAMADAWLNRYVGIAETLTFNALVDPRIYTGDIIHIVHPGIGVDGNYVIDTIELPLSYDQPMKLTVRRQAPV